VLLVADRHGEYEVATLTSKARFRDYSAWIHRSVQRSTAIVAAGIVFTCWSCAFALNPSLDVSQYAHTSWKISDGFSKGVIWSIAQTPDGYLWLGTEFGLLRFDGVRTVAWQPLAGEHLPNSDVRNLLVARDGRLWIGTALGLASLKDGRLTQYPELERQIIEALLEDHDGVIWVACAAPSLGKLCKIENGETQCYGADGSFGSAVTALYEDSGGSLWTGAMTGLWRWKPGPPQFYRMPDPANRIHGLIESDDGGILVTKNSGITKLRNGKAEPYPLPFGLEFSPGALFRDHDGGLWIGAVIDRGLLHIHDGRMDLFTRSDGLSSNAVSSFLEDREGNIWVVTVDGLDRFRDFAITTISVQQGLSSHAVNAILAGRDGSLWLGTNEGLNRWKNGEVTIYRKRRLPTVRGGSALTEFTDGWAADSRRAREIIDDGLPEDLVESLFEDHHGQIWVMTRSGVAILKSDRFVSVSSLPFGLIYAITGDRSGNVWVSHQEALFHLREGRMVEQIPWAKLGRREPATALLDDAVGGGFWLGFRDGGVAYFKDGQLRASYAGVEGLAGGRVNQLRFGPHGGLWVATEAGMSRIKDGHVSTLSSKNGLPCDTLHWTIQDDAGSVWLYMECGLVRIARSELDDWFSNPQLSVHASVFDSFDGVRSHRFHFGNNSVVTKSTDGKLWFVPFGGVSVLDPHHLPINKLPPPVHIEQIIADRKTHDVVSQVRLPPSVRDLEIDFTALSFVAPEKVRFRYKLEGYDSDWHDAGNRRQAFYTNLPPKQYRFRVIACNNDGVWNEQGALLDFSIAPTFYQRTSFRALCVVGLMALLVLAYQLRVRQLAGKFNRTLEARLSERTRIARELHDTLLQSFQGLLLRFQSVSNVLPPNAHEAKHRLDSALDQAADAITEGRNAVQGLRSSATQTNDLANGIIAFGQELTNTESAADSPVIEVEVEGGPRQLNPVVRDEAYRIAGEALRNACQHAQARRIAVEIRYDRRRFLLRVRDDGQGISEDTIRRGHAGHFGLHGMRERAQVVGGRLEVWSKLNSGTQIELSIPGRIAYDASVRRSWLSQVLSGNNRDHGSTRP
jgi:signal transduction histidine kinase/ligand-binding sensor domain-containing protein